MQIEIFTLCDNAQVYAGKAVVIGAFNQIKVQKLPVMIPSLTLAVRVSFDKTEAGDKTFYFDIKNPDGTPLVPELCCETKQQEQLGKHDSLISYDMNIVFGNLSLNQAGGYTINMKHENKNYKLEFFVLER